MWSYIRINKPQLGSQDGFQLKELWLEQISAKITKFALFFEKERLYYGRFSQILIERTAKKIRVTVVAARPGIYYYRQKGSDVEKLKSDIQKLDQQRSKRKYQRRKKKLKLRLN